MILDHQDRVYLVKQFQLVIDLVLDDTDLMRLENNKPGYLYTTKSNSLYLKHLNHLDYHPPNLVVSYGKENHHIIHLPTMRSQRFMLDHQDLDEFYSVALGVTDHLAMIALGDSHHTRLQVVDVKQSLKVFFNTTYMEQDAPFFPVPRYFTGNPVEAILVYSDNSRLHLDLQDFTIGQRQEPEVDTIVKSKKVLDGNLSILGPFILLNITDKMTADDLKHYKLLIEQAAESNWIAVDNSTLVHKRLVKTRDFDEEIQKREEQIKKLLELVSEK